MVYFSMISLEGFIIASKHEDVSIFYIYLYVKIYMCMLQKYSKNSKI